MRRLQRKCWRLCLKPQEMLSPAPEKTSGGKKPKLADCSEAARAEGFLFWELAFFSPTLFLELFHYLDYLELITKGFALARQGISCQ